MISVVLPCYNAAATLDACLISLRRQTWADFEIIAVDDGSTDRTLDVLQFHAVRDERVRVFARPHGGVVRAMNFGMSQARGEYIARMDSDDICLPHRLGLQKAYLDRRPEVGLVGGLMRFGGDGERCLGYKTYVDWINTVVEEDEISLYRFVESPLANPSIMFRKELVSRHGPFYDGPFPEDYEFLLRLLEAGVILAKVREDVIVWNDPPTRLSRTDFRYAPDAFYRIKAGYLARWLLARGIGQVMVVGGGRITRRRAMMLESHGVTITAWLEVDPDKIGQTVHGRPVLDWRDLGRPNGSFLLSFVGNRGARERIVRELTAQGWHLGIHFLPAA